MASDVNLRVLADFLDYLRIEKGLARLSINAYNTDIQQFAGFLEKHQRDLLGARRTDVREFLQQLFLLYFFDHMIKKTSIEPLQSDIFSFYFN